MSDPKVFGKHFKSRLLDSVVNDPNYIVNNAYDYIRLKTKKKDLV